MSTGEPSGGFYLIGIVAELAGVHPQTLRLYERRGLISPRRSAGKTRRYSDADLAVLRRIQAAHSLAMARWVSLFFRRISNSVP